MFNVLQSGVASAERVFELLDAEEQSPDHDRAGRARRAQGPGRVRARVVLVRPRPAADRGPLAGRRAGPDGGDRRPHRRRQDDARQPDHAFLRARRRVGSRSTASTSRRCAGATCAANIGMVLQDTWLFGGTIRENIAYGNLDATEEQILEAARATYVDRFVHSLPDGYDTVIDDEGSERQRRREAADHHRPGVPRRPDDPDPRRGDELGRHPHRGADPAGDGGAALGAHELRDRPPAVDDPRRRHDPGDGGRAASSSRATTPSCSPSAGRTTTSTTPSSPAPSPRSTDHPLPPRKRFPQAFSSAARYSRPRIATARRGQDTNWSATAVTAPPLTVTNTGHGV